MRKLGKIPFIAVFLAFVWVVCFTAELGSLEKINFREDNGRVLLEFKGSERLRYRVKEYQSPPHLLVQFYGTNSSLPYDNVEVNKGNVTHLSIREMQVNGETATFVSVHMNYNSDFDFNLSQDGKQLQMTVRSSGAPSGVTAVSGQSGADIAALVQDYTYREETGEGLPPVIQIPGEKKGTTQIPYTYMEQRTGDEVEIPYKVKEDDTSPYIVGPVILQDADISQTIRLLSEAAGGANIVVESSIVGKRAEGGGITVTLSHITLEDALDVITVSNGWTWRKYGDYYSIMSKETAMEGVESQPAGFVYDDSASRMKVVFVKPKSSYACQMVAFLKSVIPDVGCDSTRNLLVMRGMDRDIARAREIIKTIDVPITDVTRRASQVTKVIRLKYIKLDDDFARELRSVTGNSYFAGLQVENTSVEAVNTVTFDKATNSMIFVGDDYIYERFYNLIMQLDIQSRQKVVRVIALRYATVNDIRSLEAVGKLASSPDITLTYSESTNTITYTGPEDDFGRIREVIDGVDIEARRYVTEVLDLKNIRAGDIKSSAILENLGKFPGFGLNSEDCETCGTNVEFDLQTNSVIISTQQQYLDNIRNLIQSMDQNVFDDYEFEAFRLKYANSYRTVQIVGQLMTTEAEDTTYPGDGGFFTYPDSFTGSNVQDFEGLYMQSYKWMMSPSVADNTIYTLARPQEMGMIRAIINNIDQPRDQLKLDVQVIELTRNDDTRYRLGYVSKDGKFAVGGNVTDNYAFNNQQQTDKFNFFEGTFKEDSDAILNDFSGGFIVYNTLTNYVAGLSLNLDVLVQKVNGRIVANPSVMVPEAKMVTFDFSESIPYTIVSFGQIEVRTANNGIVMDVTPHFRDGFVLLDLNIKVSEVVGYTSQQYPIESARKIVSQIKCEDGIPFIIGGIIKSQESLTRVSFPVLSDLPLVGSLFRKKQKKVEEYEVVMVITPTISKLDF